MSQNQANIQLVARKNIFYETSYGCSQITWKCAKFYTKTKDPNTRCRVSIGVRMGVVCYVRGYHNHPDTYIESKHGSRKCFVDVTGKYRIIGKTPGAANTHARRPQNSAQQHYPEHVPTEDWFYIKSSKGTVQLVATNNIFYEDINSHEKRITWRCSKFYTKTPDRDRCQVSICLRSGYLAYVKGQHNHPDTYIISKHASRRCEVDMTGKYKITGEWLPGKNPLLNKSNPEGRIRMKDTSKLKMKKIDKPIQNLDPLNMQLNAQLLTSQMLIKLKEESINNITNSNVVNVPSNAENQPDIEEKDGISWHIPTFDGFF